MIGAALRAIGDVLGKSFRTVLLRAFLLTLALLIGLGALAHYGLAAVPEFKWHWINTALKIVGDLGIVVGSVLLAAPAASLVISLFLDDVASAVERQRYPQDPPGKTLGVMSTLTTALAFLFALILVNLLALPLYLIPGANLVIFLLVNGYLIGREYFELVAFRHQAPAFAARLRRSNWLSVFLGGVIIAGVLSIPVVNLLAPLFGTAFMVHLYKLIEKKNAARAVA